LSIIIYIDAILLETERLASAERAFGASAGCFCSSKPLRGRLSISIIVQFHYSWYLLTGLQVGIFTRQGLKKKDTMNNLIKRFKKDLQLAGYAKLSSRQDLFVHSTFCHGVYQTIFAACSSQRIYENQALWFSQSQ